MKREDDASWSETAFPRQACTPVHIQTDAMPQQSTGWPFHLHGCVGWWRSTVVERRSLTGELSLSCARPAADG